MIRISRIITLLAAACVVTSTQPEFEFPMQNMSVPVGRDAKFSCVVAHLGGYRGNQTKLQVGWVKADTKAIQAIHTHVITHNVRVSVSHSGHNTWNLNIREVQEEDRGPYMCQINTDPMRFQIAHLEVTVPPEIIDAESSTDIMVPEGATAILVCRARGHPTPTVIWRREDEDKLILIRSNNSSKASTRTKTYQGEVLNLTNIKRSDMGPYLCIASNNVPPIVSKRIMVEVNFSPVVHVPNQLISAPLGASFGLTCYIEASPKSIQYWTREDGTMLIDDHEFGVSDTYRGYYETTMNLTVLSLKRKQVGVYHCHSKNSIGEVYGTIRVNERIIPTEPYQDYDETNSYEYESHREISNKIPHDPSHWDNTSPASEAYDNKGKDDVKGFSPYPPNIPNFRSTKRPWPWSPNSSTSSTFKTNLSVCVCVVLLRWFLL